MTKIPQEALLEMREDAKTALEIAKGAANAGGLHGEVVGPVAAVVFERLAFERGRARRIAAEQEHERTLKAEEAKRGF